MTDVGTADMDPHAGQGIHEFPCSRCGRVICAAFTSYMVAQDTAMLLGWRGVGKDWYCPECWPLHLKAIKAIEASKRKWEASRRKPPKFST